MNDGELVTRLQRLGYTFETEHYERSNRTIAYIAVDNQSQETRFRTRRALVAWMEVLERTRDAI